MQSSIVALAVPITLCAAATVASPDEVRLRSGESLLGEWPLERMALSTDGGEVIVPNFNILSILPDEDGGSVTLTDGTALSREALQIVRQRD